MTPDQAVLRVRVDRGRWLRGATDATLRNPDTCHECIVGTIARTAGIPAERLEKHCRISQWTTSRSPPSCTSSTRTATTSPGPGPASARTAVPVPVPAVRHQRRPAARRHRARADAHRRRRRIGIELSFTGTPLPPHAIPPTTDGRARQGAISRGYLSSSPHGGCDWPRASSPSTVRGERWTRPRWCSTPTRKRPGRRLRPAAQLRLRARRRRAASRARRRDRTRHRRRLPRAGTLKRRRHNAPSP